MGPSWFIVAGYCAWLFLYVRAAWMEISRQQSFFPPLAWPLFLGWDFALLWHMLTGPNPQSFSYIAFFLYIWPLISLAMVLLLVQRAIRRSDNRAALLMPVAAAFVTISVFAMFRIWPAYTVVVASGYGVLIVMLMVEQFNWQARAKQLVAQPRLQVVRALTPTMIFLGCNPALLDFPATATFILYAAAELSLTGRLLRG